MSCICPLHVCVVLQNDVGLEDIVMHIHILFIYLFIGFSNKLLKFYSLFW